MTSDADRLRRVRELFDATADLEPGARRAYLAAHAADDPELRAEVIELIGESERTAPGLALGLSSLAPPHGDAAKLVGQRLGAYDVVRVLGLGGMGAVYEGMRADDQYRKRVAIKLVQVDRETPFTLARFRRERQILASLQHRNIATLLDGGVTPDGRPFLVMEYVAGEPITTWCDQRRLGVEQRLALFRQVCEAVRHAHRNLVIHRDIKPGNILVTPEGDVKLLDFGVAKFGGDETDDADMPLTRGGARLFTPEYASPEQIRGEVLTTASDVYSLGAVLYELLAGRRPHMATGSSAVVERAVLEEPITRPSAVVSDEAARARGERSTVALRKRLEGELDSIVMLALRPEPESRWRSADAFTDDIKRHLEGLPVEAQRGWRGYQLGKFLARHRAAVVATVLVMLALVGGVITTGIEARRARAAQARAERVRDFLGSLLQSVRPATGGRDVPVSELLDAAAKRIGSELSSDPEVQAELERVIGESEFSLGRLDEATRHLRASLAIEERLHGRDSEQSVEALSYLGAVDIMRGETASADSIVQRCLAIARARKGGNSDRDTLVSGLISQLGSVAHDRGDMPLAEKRHREALAIDERAAGPASDRVARSLNNVAVAVGEQGRLAEAEQFHRRALAIFRHNHEGLSVEIADAENALATMLDLQGKYAEADSLYSDVLQSRQALLGIEHPNYAFTLMNYSMFIFDRGRFEESMALTRQLLAMRGKSLPESHPAIAAALQTLGRSLDRLGRHDEARRALLESLELRRRYIGPTSWAVASSLGVLGDHERQMKHYAEAERLLLEADAGLTRELGPDNPRALTNAQRLATLYEETGRPALASLQRARHAPRQP